jgi:hypothetical protein
MNLPAVEIENKPVKQILTLITCILLIIICCVYFILPKEIITASMSPRKIRRIMDEPYYFGFTIFGSLITGICAMYNILLGKQIGLIIDSTGITYKQGRTKSLIKWSEVINVESQIKNNEMVTVVFVDNSSHYTSKNSFELALKENEMKLIGSPRIISAKDLKITSKELLELVEKYYTEFNPKK